MDPVKAYDILLQRQINEDRIIGERTSMFLLANSFLFLAFVTLLNPNYKNYVFEILRFALPIVGILLSALIYSANRAAINALAFWHGGQKAIELSAAKFRYMMKNGIAPHVQGNDAVWGKIMWKSREWTTKKGIKKYSIELVDTTTWRRILLHPWLRPTSHYLTSILFPLIFALWVAALVVAIVL